MISSLIDKINDYSNDCSMISIIYYIYCPYYYKLYHVCAQNIKNEITLLRDTQFQIYTVPNITFPLAHSK